MRDASMLCTWDVSTLCYHRYRKHGEDTGLATEFLTSMVVRNISMNLSGSRSWWGKYFFNSSML